MDEVLDRSEAGDATAARRPRRQPMPAERPSDLVEPLAMLQQRASDVGHRTVPRWSGELGMNGTEHRTNRAPASALPPNGRQDHQPWPSAGPPTTTSTPRPIGVLTGTSSPTRRAARSTARSNASREGLRTRRVSRCDVASNASRISSIWETPRSLRGPRARRSPRGRGATRGEAPRRAEGAGRR